MTYIPTSLSIVSSVDLINQTADIATATLASVPGMYLVEVVLEDTAVDILAGAVTLTITWTDDAGSANTTISQLLTGVERTTVNIPIQLASGVLDYTTTHSGIFGSSAYSLYIRVIKI